MDEAQPFNAMRPDPPADRVPTAPYPAETYETQAAAATESQQDDTIKVNGQKPNVLEETFLSGGSTSDESYEPKVKPEEVEQTPRRSCSTAVYVVIFVVVLAAVTIPLVISMNDSAAAPTSVPALSQTGGLPLPAPIDAEPNIPPTQTDASVGPPTPSPSEGPSSAPVTMLPTKDGETFAPTTLSPTQHPTTDVPTFIPSASPSFEPSAYPSLSPTTVEPTVRGETPSPSASPTIGETDEPSAGPTSPPVDSTGTPLFSYLSTLGTPPDILGDPTTPQGKAYLWLLEPGVEQVSVFRVPQRFALVALDFALHEQEIRVVSAWQAFIDWRQENSYTPWRRKDRDICDWDGVTCNEHNEVTGIKWSNQELRGRIIPEIKLLPKLKKVDLAENRLKGDLEPFWDLPNLTHLYLFSNRLTGTIPGDRPAPGKLQHVYLGNNELTGTLPLSLASAKNNKGPTDLRYLILHNNQLTGTFPDGMRLRKLFYLDLSNNQFEGPVPSDWVLYMQSLRILYLGHNRLSGQLPDDFSSIGGGRLKQLFIENNNFSGYFPGEGWDDYFMTNMNIANNNFDERLKKLCKISVWEEGEMVEMRADCDICNCESLCHTCEG